MYATHLKSVIRITVIRIIQLQNVEIVLGLRP